jgi:hypothetical protein
VYCASGVGVGVIDQGVSREKGWRGHRYGGTALLNIQWIRSFRLFSDLLLRLIRCQKKSFFRVVKKSTKSLRGPFRYGRLQEGSSTQLGRLQSTIVTIGCGKQSCDSGQQRRILPG